MTTIIILSAAALIGAFVLGFAAGHARGKQDGYAEHSDHCRIRCAIRRGGRK